MRVRFLFVLGLAGLTSSAAAALPGWTFIRLSELLADQPRFPATRFDRAPSVQAQGVVWLADNPMVSRSLFGGGNAIAFWDRTGVSYLTPYPPEWSWTGVWEPSACGADVALPLEGIWPPDAGPNDAQYMYTEIFQLDDLGLHRITWDHASGHARPSLHEGKIAWQSRSAENSGEEGEIYFWDGAAIRRITDNDVNDTDPSLYANIIAWCSGGNIVYLSVPADGYTGPLPTPTLVGPGQYPSVFQNKIAYHASDGHDMEIFLYDVQSSETLQITDNDFEDTNPSLFDGTAAWQAAERPGQNADIFYWDGSTIHRLTDDPWHDEAGASLWGTGLNTTIAYTQGCLHCVPAGSRVVCARRTVLSVLAGPGPREITITWPGLEGRTYQVEYSEDLVNWRVAPESVPSAGYAETSWTDGEGSGTVPSPSAVSRRFYRVCEVE